MNFFVSAASKPHIQSMKVRAVSLAVATIFVVMVVAQLFTYEDFPAVIDGLWQTGGMTAAYILAASIVTCEVFALPFLLSMSLSPLMRLVSMVCGWFAASTWLIVALWRGGTASGTVNVGLLGATVPVSNEWVAVLSSLVLAIGVGYVSYAFIKRPGHKTA